MSDKFGWCFIGCGTLAGKVASQIVKSGRHKIVSVYSRTFKNCEKFAGKFGGAAFRSAEEAMTAEGVDGVYIVTPHTSHFQYSKLAIELGKPVLCEKPFTVDAKSTKALIDFAKEKGIYIAEAMWTWFSPVANKVKEWLDCGEFGEIKSVHANWHTPMLYYAPRVTNPALAGGALLDIGIYPVTYIFRLFGKPQRVECTGKVSKGIDWGEDIKMYYPSGAVYTASVSMKDLKGLEKLRIEGSKAKLILPFFHWADKVTLVRKGEKNEKLCGDGSYLNEFDIVASEIREGLTESRLVKHADTLAVLEILDECRKQMNLVYPFEK